MPKGPRLPGALPHGFTMAQNWPRRISDSFRWGAPFSDTSMPDSRSTRWMPVSYEAVSSLFLAIASTSAWCAWLSQKVSVRRE